jgi:hypothetical protein
MVEMKLRSFLVCSLSSEQMETQCSFWSLLSSLGTDFSAMCCMLGSLDRIHWHIPYHCLTMSQTSWIGCLRSSRISSHTFATFSVVVPVEGRPECSSSLTDIRLFLKCWNHSQVWVRPRALSPNASVSILCVSTTILPNLKQNLMQIRYSFTSVILSSWYDCKTALIQRLNNAYKNEHVHFAWCHLADWFTKDTACDT